MPFLEIEPGSKVEAIMKDNPDMDKDKNEGDETKMYDEMSVYIPGGITSFSELDQLEMAKESMRKLRKRGDQLNSLIDNIMADENIEDKGEAIQELASEFGALASDEMSKERWQPLTDKAVNLIADHTKQERTMKTEGGVKFPASDFAYVPDPEKPSTWKLRMTETPGKITRSQLGAAAAAFSPGGFRGQKVQIPSGDMAGVKAKIRAAYTKLGVDEKDIPPSIRKERNDFMIYKQSGGVYRWVAIYSNKFRDRDNPPEIISEASHQNFVKQVNSGELPYPDLWLWHIKGSKWGVADFIGWDDSGFAVASGTVDRGKEWIAESLLSNGLDMLTSHGMPRDSVKRDPNDRTVIIEHVTKEISPLLASSAANEYTGFNILDEVKQMALSNEDKAKLEGLGIDPERLEAETESKAKEAEGLEFKETEENNPEFISRDEMTELVKSIASSTNQLTEVVSKLVERVEVLESNKLTVDKKTLERTPAASLNDLYKSVIGSEESKVDGRTTLAKSGPEETPVEQSYKTLADVIIKRNRQIERGGVQ